MLKYIVCFLAITSALSQVTFTSGTYKTAGTAPTVTTYTNGIMIGTSAAGWILSDAITSLTATTASTIVTTIVPGTLPGNLAIGFASTVAGACDATTLSGATYNVLDRHAAATTCKSDFITVYTTAPGASAVPTDTDSDTGVTALQVDGATRNSIKWVVTPPASVNVATNCHQVDIFAPTTTVNTFLAGATPSVSVNPAGACQGTKGSTGTAAVKSNTAGGYMISTLTYGLYIEQYGTGSAQVCVQTLAQYAIAAGVCGTAVPTATPSSVGWASPTIYQANSANVATVKSFTQGYVASFTAPGYVISEAMSTLYSTAASSYTVYATVTAHTAAVGFGLTAIGTDTPASLQCTATQFTTEHAAATANLQNGATAGKKCPSDFITAYTTLPGTTSDEAKVKANLVVLATKPTAKFTVIAPAQASLASTTACYPASFYGPGNSAATLTLTGDYNPSGVCSGTTGAGLMVTKNYYGVYAELQAAGTATICFQTQAQYTASPGNCGTASTSGSSGGSSASSASLLSVIMTPFIMAIVAFFN